MMILGRPLRLGLLAVFLAASAFIQYQAHQLRATIAMPGARHALEGKTAPEFSLLDEEGNEVRLQELRGSVVILDFWATWCGPCRRTFPLLDKLQKERPELVVLAVNLKESPQQVEQYLNNEGFEARVVFDRDGEVARQYGVSAIPTQVLIDQKGRVRGVEVGFSPMTFLTFRAKAERLLK